MPVATKDLRILCEVLKFSVSISPYGLFKGCGTPGAQIMPLVLGFLLLRRAFSCFPSELWLSSVRLAVTVLLHQLRCLFLFETSIPDSEPFPAPSAPLLLLLLSKFAV